VLHLLGEVVSASVKEMLTARGSALTSTMYRDMQKDRIETGQFVGDLVSRARGAEVPTCAGDYVFIRRDGVAGVRHLAQSPALPANLVLPRDRLDSMHRICKAHVRPGRRRALAAGP
jgi:hypothetical protein